MEMISHVCTYISGISSPTLDGTAAGDAEIIENTNLRFIQSVVVAEIFYESSYGRFDIVLVVREDTKFTQLNGRTRYSSLFAKVLRLINVLNSLP